MGKKKKTVLLCECGNKATMGMSVSDGKGGFETGHYCKSCFNKNLEKNFGPLNDPNYEKALRIFDSHPTPIVPRRAR